LFSVLKLDLRLYCGLRSGEIGSKVNIELKKEELAANSG
jgi:hypothetical protein